MKGLPLRLAVTFAQKFHVWELSNLLYGGIELEETGHEIRIYRFDGRNRSRMDMSDYDTTYDYWLEDHEYDIDKRMKVLGYTKVWQDDISSHPDQFHRGYHGRELYYDLDTTNPDFTVPALYKDVWTLSIKGHGTLGPFSQDFRLDARVYTPLPEKFVYWFDLTPYPNILPYDNLGFPMAIGCSPVIQNLTNAMPISAARSLMSCMKLTMVDAWRVYTETGGVVYPEEYYAINSVFPDQVFNYFFGCWNTTGLPAGQYRVRFRIDFDIGPPGTCGRMSSQAGNYVDYWKAITIAKNTISTLPTPISIPYDVLESAPVATYLYPYPLYYDNGAHRFMHDQTTSVSQFHEPRNLEATYAESYNPQEIVTWTTETSAVVASDYYLEYPVLWDCNPMVFLNGSLAIPSIPIDGSVVATQGDYKIVGNKLSTLLDPWYSLSVSYARKGKAFPSGNQNDYFDAVEAQPYDGKHYFLLTRMPNLSLFVVYTQNLLVDPADYAVILTGGAADYFGCAVLEFDAAKYLDINYWIWVWYSYTGATTGVTYPNMQSIMVGPDPYPCHTGSLSTIVLPRNLTGDMTPLLYHGPSFKVIDVDYEFILADNGSQSYVNLLTFTPTLPIQMWFN